METKEVLELAQALCTAPGISGREGDRAHGAAEVAKELLAPLGKVEVSPLGSVICTVQEGKAGAPHLMLEAHLDQIGMVVTCLEDGGFVRVSNVGGLDRRLLPALPVTIHAKTGDYAAVVASTPPHLSGGEEKPMKMEDLVIDTGFSDEKARELFAPGDPITMDSAFTVLGEERMLSASQDDRIGCVAVIGAAREIARTKPDCRVTVVLASMEEVGGQGAGAAAFALAPDEAIAVDVSFADGFGVPKSHCGKMGGGPMIGIAPALDNAMTARLEALAGEEGIPCQLEAMGGRTSTDADAIFVARGGVRTALISIPLRNMHTSVELVDARDVAMTAQLLAAYAKEVH